MDETKPEPPNHFKTSLTSDQPVTSLEVLDSIPSPDNLRQNGGCCPNSPYDNPHQRSPSPRYRQYSGSTTPTRTPSPTLGGEVEEKPPVKTKSVSFHSQTNWKKDRKIQSAHDCLEYMMEGSSLIKLRSNGRQYHRYFRLLEDLSAIRWTPTSKKATRAQVPIEQIKEVRTGKNCESLRHKNFPVGYNEERIFSILYGPSYESLDLIAHNAEEANIWVTGLNALIGASQSPETSDDPNTLRETWLRETFERATRDSAGYIDQATCIQLIKKLDNQVATVRVKQKLLEVDISKSDGYRGRVGIQEFIDMFKEISTRPEIYFLMIRYANKDYLTRDDFHLFLEGEQGMSGLTEEKVLDLIKKYEPTSEARKCGQILIDGFTKYLLSEECDIFDNSQKNVCQDMTHPLTHYFISTSHNTYLLEDQLKGPSSIDGYIRVLTCGCRCVKVDVYDGPDEPVVYHGNTLTSKVMFREVIDAIASYSFDYSVYPVFVHLENHCSVQQQKIVAELIKALFGTHLYVHPPNSEKRLCDLSPEELKFKIILMGKKLPEGQLEAGEVSEEDEGGETSRNNNPKKITLSPELSSLISISRNRTFDPRSPSSKGSAETLWSMSESTTAKLIHGRAEEVVNHNKMHLMRVYPNSSRVDSSNYNPQDFWNAGVQMVALNFQTPGQMMDVYEGRFRGNGACGYVLKPSVMREQIAVFCASSKDSIPGVAPQLLKIKIISGQCLPKPRGSTAVKASFIDPYVVIQVFGIPADCTEAKTRTVSDTSNCPVFDESFDFTIHLPELTLLRFLVLDDEYIGDDFIGQCTVAFDCLQTGYRHIRLLSSMGEPMDNATLFVHISISSKKGGKSHSSWGRRSQKLQTELKGIGVKQADDIFKDAVSALADAEQIQHAVESAWTELQEMCGLDHTANMKQCLKVVISRFLAHPGNPTLSIVKEDDIPFLRSSIPGPLPSHLHKVETALEKLLLEIHHLLREYDNMKQALEKHLQPALNFYDNLEQCLTTQGARGKKANKSRESFAYNVRVIRGQLDRLDTIERKSRIALEQVESTQVMLSSLNNRDRSPAVRERPKLSLTNRYAPLENSYGSLGRSPTSPNPPMDCKPKSILKKSNSNIESRSLGYVNEEGEMSQFFFEGPFAESDQTLLKPPLHHSLSYTPGYELEPSSVHYDSSQDHQSPYLTSSSSIPPDPDVGDLVTLYDPERNQRNDPVTLYDPERHQRNDPVSLGHPDAVRPVFYTPGDSYHQHLPPSNYRSGSLEPYPRDVDFTRNIKRLSISSDDCDAMYDSSMNTKCTARNRSSYEPNNDDLDPSTAL